MWKQRSGLTRPCCGESRWHSLVSPSNFIGFGPLASGCLWWYHNPVSSVCECKEKNNLNLAMNAKRSLAVCILLCCSWLQGIPCEIHSFLQCEFLLCGTVQSLKKNHLGESTAFRPSGLDTQLFHCKKPMQEHTGCCRIETATMGNDLEESKTSAWQELLIWQRKSRNLSKKNLLCTAVHFVWAISTVAVFVAHMGQMNAGSIPAGEESRATWFGVVHFHSYIMCEKEKK